MSGTNVYPSGVTEPLANAVRSLLNDGFSFDKQIITGNATAINGYNYITGSGLTITVPSGLSAQTQHLIIQDIGGNVGSVATTGNVTITGNASNVTFNGAIVTGTISPYRQISLYNTGTDAWFIAR